MTKDFNHKKSEHKSQKPAILFSLDGALLKTDPAILATYREVFSRFGHESEFTPEMQLEVLDASVTKMMQKFFHDCDTQECMNVYDSYQRDHLIDLIQPVDGAEDLLQWLKKHHYKVGILSTRERSSIIELLERKRLIQYIDTVIGGTSSHSDYVTSTSIVKACRILEVHNCIFVGDSASDVAAGKESGAYTIGVVYNHKKALSIVAEGPDFATGDIRQIKKLLQGEPMWIAYRVYQPEEIEQQKPLPQNDKNKKKKKS